jgi:hypothetical protein
LKRNKSNIDNDNNNSSSSNDNTDNINNNKNNNNNYIELTKTVSNEIIGNDSSPLSLLPDANIHMKSESSNNILKRGSIIVKRCSVSAGGKRGSVRRSVSGSEYDISSERGSERGSDTLIVYK